MKFKTSDCRSAMDEGGTSLLLHLTSADIHFPPVCVCVSFCGKFFFVGFYTSDGCYYVKRMCSHMSMRA